MRASPWNHVPIGIEERLHTTCETTDFCNVCQPVVETDSEGFAKGVVHQPVGFWRAALLWALVALAWPAERYADSLRARSKRRAAAIRSGK